MKRITAFLWCTLLCTSLSSSLAIAGSADYIYNPIVEFGEREIDMKFGSAALPNDKESWALSVGYGLGVTEYWFTEVIYKEKINAGKRTAEAEWENKFQLTEAGEYPVDVGALVEIEAPLSGSQPWGIKLGGLFQTEFSKLQLNGNLLLKRKFGISGRTFNTTLLYQLQAKYRLQPTFEFGVQGFGNMGKWNDWSQQSKQNHLFGPAVFGKIKLGTHRAIKYNAAWLFAASRGAPRNTLRTQVEYEF